MQRNTPHETILLNSPISPNLPANHPLFYATEKNYFLQTLSQQASLQSRLPTHDMQRNIRVDYYMGKYLLKKKEVEKEQKEMKAKLNAEEFQSIFESEGQKERKREQKQKRIQQKIRQRMYQQYIEEGSIYQQPQHDYDYQQLNTNGLPAPKTILTMNDPLRQKQLYLLDLQISKLRQEESISKKVAQSHQICKNDKLLSKLSTSLISSYMVYFDEIYNKLIDEILEEEVLYLNALEAEYRIEGNNTKGKEKQIKQNNSYAYAQNVKTLKMMELVKQLDQLCDQ